ncbi:MAG: glycoside hydrolase family 97 protein [Ignavibacteria bacterium]|nr:glycoside hydrolase family 97 protein [Ignavibacteria bacterium]
MTAEQVLSSIVVFSFALLTITRETSAQGDPPRLSSPDKKTAVRIELGKDIRLSILHNEEQVLALSNIALELDGNRLIGRSPAVSRTETRSVSETITPVVPEKRSVIPDVFNELTIHFKGNYGLIIRAYNDGVAYRLFTRLPGEITVKHEHLEIIVSPDDSIFFPEETSFLSHSERLYKYLAVKEIADTQMCCIPALLAKENGWKVAITESDLLDYPGLYFRGAGKGEARLKSKFPPYPLEEQLVGDRTIKVTKRADYIAKTKGSRQFPWRVFAVSEKDGDLIENDIVYRLGSPLRLKETFWIKPGKVAWDWWNANNVYGVDFKSGINTQTYKYYIDFASQYSLEYIILDEGWSKPSDLFQINPEMNMDELFAYAKQKNVGIILWVVWNVLDEQMNDALDQFARWGAKGIKVDFMQRDDQKVVNYYEKVAQEAAKRHLLVDFHGSYKPTGFSRSYPHVLTREGVQGLEQSKWSFNITPKHDVTLPFTRMFAGAMDYTPGAMVNATKDNFRPIFNQPMSQGTRCHQLAMYVIYESPLQMLCDCPTNYLREPEAMEFLSAVPTVWDETRALDAKVGEYLTVARKKGEDWFVGSMTDWTPRDIEINLRFLPRGKYQATIYADGPNAHRYASDYRKERREVSRSDVLRIHLAPGGGWAAHLAKLD